MNSKWNALVKVDTTQLLSGMNTACRMYSNVKYLVFCIIVTSKNSGIGWHIQLVTSGPRAGASGERVSRPTTARNSLAFPSDFVFCIFVRTSRFQVLQAMSVKQFAQIFEDLKI